MHAMLTASSSFVSVVSRRAAKRTVSARAGAVSVNASADRPLWLPGGEAPAHLTGSLPGDFGFDPLKLGADPENLKWFKQAELMNGRWAMLGAAGCLVPELLTKAGVADLPTWADAGKAEYFTDPVTLVLVQGILFNWVEVLRWKDMRNPGSVHEDPIFKGNKVTGTEVGYPGGRWFDPFNFAAEPKTFELNKVKEIKNGRLAMVAMAGFFVQAFVTGKGPVDNLYTHIAAPGANTFFSN